MDPGIEKQKLIKIVIIGDMGVGKTTLLQRYLKDIIPRQIQSTIGVEFGAEEYQVGENKYTIQFWDTAGQEKYKSITVSHFRRSVGAFIVFDVNQQSSFDNVVRWYEDLQADSDKNVKIVLIGNKNDMPEQRQVSQQKGEELAKQYNFIYYETSAFKDDHKKIQQVFKSLIEMVIQAQENKTEMPQNFNLARDQAQTNNDCSKC